MANQLPLSLWLDGIVGGLAVAAVMAAVVGPVLAVTGGSFAAVVTTLAYPLLDVVLLLIVTAVLALFHWRPPVGSVVPGRPGSPRSRSPTWSTSSTRPTAPTSRAASTTPSGCSRPC